MIRLCLFLIWLAAPSARAAEHHPPGILVPVFDTTLHLDCTGSGTPTVMLEAGLAGNFLDWTLLRPLLDREFRVCAYDRAGAGFSGRTARPRTVVSLAADLHELVNRAAVSRPFVLVGHSFGGLIAAAYAQNYPGDLAGLVLLDAMHPQQFDRFVQAGIHVETDPHLVIGRTSGFAATYRLPDALHPLAMDLALADTARVFVFREMAQMLNSAHDLQAMALPHLPARVLVHGNGEWQAVPPAGRMEAVWRELQADYAARLGAPAPVLVPDSGHQIALDAPHAVADAVRAVAGDYRANTATLSSRADHRN